MSTQTNKQANKQANKTQNTTLNIDDIYIINDYINNVKLLDDDNEIIKNYIKGLYLIKLCLKYTPNNGNIDYYELNERNLRLIPSPCPSTKVPILPPR